MAGPSSTELTFARKLAHNDLKIRKKAVRKLRNFLSKASDALDEPAMLKLWKGLFYCMWMSDKAQVQDELADRLAKLLQCFPDDDKAALFYACFFKTMVREWQGIDRLRLDKFYNLINQFVKQGFARVQQAKWGAAALQHVMGVLEEGPCLLPRPEALGIALHLCDHLVGNLHKVPGAVPGVATFAILEPFFCILVSSPVKALVNRVEENIFGRLMEMEQDASEGALKHNLGVDWTKLCDKMFAKAADAATPTSNRERLYSLRKEILKHIKYMKKAAEIKAEADAMGTGADADADVGADDSGASTDPASEPASDEEPAAGKRKGKRKRTAKAKAAPEEGEADAAPAAATAAGKDKGKGKDKGAAAAAAAVAGAGKDSAKTKRRKKAAEEAAVAAQRADALESMRIVPATPVAEQADTEATPAQKTKKKKKKKSKKLEAAPADAGDGTPQAERGPKRKKALLKGLLKTPETPRRSGRLNRRVSWGEDQVRRFKKQLPPSSVGRKKPKASPA